MDPLTNDHSLDRLSSDPSTAQRIVRALCSLNLNSLRILFRNGPSAALSFVSHSYHLYSGFGLPHLWRDCLGGMTSEFRRRKSTNCSRKWIALARPSCFFLFPELSACCRPFPAKTKSASSTGINPRKPGSSSYSSAWMPGIHGHIAPLPKSSSAMSATACRDLPRKLIKPLRWSSRVASSCATTTVLPRVPRDSGNGLPVSFPSSKLKARSCSVCAWIPKRSTRTCKHFSSILC